jgi:hypothetical protein
LYYCVKYLRRHPVEVDLTLDQIAEIALIGREIDKAEAENASALINSLLGSRL